MSRVQIDVERGEALLGPVRLQIAVAGNGLQAGGADGPVLAPLTFGLRRLLVRQAAESSQPYETLAASVLEASTLRAGSADRTALEVLALTLAGADVEAAPGFGEVARLARQSGWDDDAIDQAPAIELDRLAVELMPRTEAPWTRLVLASDEAEALTSLRDELAEQLLSRGLASGQTAEELHRATAAAGEVEQPQAVGLATERGSTPQAGGAHGETRIPQASPQPAATSADPGGERVLAVSTSSSGRTETPAAMRGLQLRRVRLVSETSPPVREAAQGFEAADIMRAYVAPGAAPVPSPLTPAAWAAPASPATGSSGPAPPFSPPLATTGAGWPAVARGSLVDAVSRPVTPEPTGASPSSAAAEVVAGDDATALVELLAAALHDEADLRGLAR